MDADKETRRLAYSYMKTRTKHSFAAWVAHRAHSRQLDWTHRIAIVLLRNTTAKERNDWLEQERENLEEEFKNG